jgi:hypothetical protein
VRLSGAERSVADAAHELEVALGSLAREPLGDSDGEDRTIDLGEVPRVAHHVLRIRSQSRSPARRVTSRATSSRKRW